MKSSSSTSNNFSLRLIHNDEIMIDIQDWRGRTLLGSACMYGNLDIVKMLVTNGANVNIRDICGVTPLMVAFKYSNYIIADYLITNGANINAFDNYGKKPHQYIYEYNTDYNYYAMYSWMCESAKSSNPTFKTKYLDNSIDLENNYIKISLLIDELFRLKNKN